VGVERVFRSLVNEGDKQGVDTEEIRERLNSGGEREIFNDAANRKNAEKQFQEEETDRLAQGREPTSLEDREASITNFEAILAQADAESEATERAFQNKEREENQGQAVADFMTNLKRIETDPGKLTKTSGPAENKKTLVFDNARTKLQKFIALQENVARFKGVKRNQIDASDVKEFFESGVVPAPLPIYAREFIPQNVVLSAKQIEGLGLSKGTIIEQDQVSGKLKRISKTTDEFRSLASESARLFASSKGIPFNYTEMTPEEAKEMLAFVQDKSDVSVDARLGLIARTAGFEEEDFRNLREGNFQRIPPDKATAYTNLLTAIDPLKRAIAGLLGTPNPSIEGTTPPPLTTEQKIKRVKELEVKQRGE